jgi:prepilin-type N-terminal cleavage/methylation domain-containing protein/prepilin-type processing-associated H-X9-DG protein
MNSQMGQSKSQSPGGNAFTLIELLVVISIIAILAAMVLPALSKTKTKGQGVYCMNNTKQLMMAWHMYAADSNERLVGAGTADPGQLSKAPFAVGWLDWTSSSDNTNTLYLVDDRYAKLGRYVGGNVRIFKCPADIFLNPLQRALGWKERCRSVSGNVGIGDILYADSDIPWDNIYVHVRKSSDFRYPSPVEAWVYLDEHPDSINDASFFNPMQNNWVDIPGTYHNGAAGFAFADGHSEIHKWRACLTSGRYPAVQMVNNFNFPQFLPGDADAHWISYHTPRISALSH